MTKARNADTHVFVYRNIVKALPWFASVREKLDDPACARPAQRQPPCPPRAWPDSRLHGGPTAPSPFVLTGVVARLRMVLEV